MITDVETLDPVSAGLLYLIRKVLDDNGAWEWNLRLVAVATAVILLALKLTIRTKYGIDWYTTIHSIITGYGSAAIVYLNVFASEQLTGIPEPLRSAQCHPPLTSLHRIVPAILMGFATIDIADSLSLGFDFIIHGILTLSVMVYFCEVNRPQIVAPFATMECSTVFLHLIRATFLNDTGSMIVQLLFAFTFTLCRIIIVPPMHFNMVRSLFENQNDCDGPYFKWVVLVFGALFNCLNGFWFYKLIRKMRRKLSGREKMRDKNSLEYTTKKD